MRECFRFDVGAIELLKAWWMDCIPPPVAVSRGEGSDRGWVGEVRSGSG